MQFFSQDGQDEFLVRAFKNKRNGFFLDIGAFDGKYYSNTYLLEKEFGWRGICIEPNPLVFEKLKTNRNCITLNCCISENIGNLKFLSVGGYGEMLSGLTEFFDEKHLQRIDAIIKEYGGSKQLIEVPSFPASSILEDELITQIDYCNIDVEGGEMNVLQSIDFTKVKIKMFTIENNYGTKEVQHFLKPKGYTLIYRLGVDDVYEYHSTRYNLMLIWRFKKIKNTLSLLNKNIKRRIFK